MSATRSLACVLTALLLAGCASSSFLPTTTGSLAPRIGPDGRYQLNALELGLPCNKLRGRIQLRVLEVRDRSLKSSPSMAARSMRWASDKTGVYRQWGTTPSVGSERDAAVLKGYNDRLGQLGCDQYDIKSELSPAKQSSWQIR